MKTFSALSLTSVLAASGKEPREDSRQQGRPTVGQFKFILIVSRLNFILETPALFLYHPRSPALYITHPSLKACCWGKI